MAASVVAATTLVGGRTESVDLSPLIRRGMLALAGVTLLATLARAQPPAGPIPYVATSPGGATPAGPATAPQPATQFPPVAGTTVGIKTPFVEENPTA